MDLKRLLANFVDYKIELKQSSLERNAKKNLSFEHFHIANYLYYINIYIKKLMSMVIYTW
jgi:hypothetical protein